MTRALQDRDRAMRPSDVAEALESAAERHREAIAYWTAVGDEDRAALERRSAEVTYQAAN